jgi:ribosomal protein S3AE
MRNNISYIEDSFVVQTKDGSVIVKPFLLTRRKVSRALKHALRLAAQNFITSFCTIRTTSDLFTDLVANKIQKDMNLTLKKLYPLALCEIRTFKVIEAPAKKA